MKLSVAFTPPGTLTPSLANIPLVSLSPTIETTGGTLAGGQTLYYAVSATDANGAESGLSFAVRAKIPAGTNTNAVSLTGLSFSPGNTAGFSVYRGSNPIQMLRIAQDQTVASSFSDAGAAAELVGPPDGNYNHANFYWRLELQPEANVELHSTTTIGKNGLGMLADNFKGALVRVTRGTGATQERVVVTNTDTTLTVTPPWQVEPDSTSYFVVADGTWKFGGVSAIESGGVRGFEHARRDRGNIGTVGQLARSGERVRTESADALADRRKRRRRGRRHTAAAGVRVESDGAGDSGAGGDRRSQRWQTRKRSRREPWACSIGTNSTARRRFRWRAISRRPIRRSR